jgi:hypothetical protein
MSSQTHWWHGILARSLMAVVGIALLMGGASSLLVSRVVGERTHQQAMVKLGELLDTVESTASVAKARLKDSNRPSRSATKMPEEAFSKRS